MTASLLAHNRTYGAIDGTRIRQLAELYLQGRSHLAEAPPPAVMPIESVRVEQQPSLI